jgi:hypothetical protein
MLGVGRRGLIFFGIVSVAIVSLTLMILSLTHHQFSSSSFTSSTDILRHPRPSSSSQTDSSQSIDLSNFTLESLPFLFESIALPSLPQILPAHQPPTEERILSSYQYLGDIYLDWIRESYQFNYLNYKSVESLLASYPKANLEMTVIGPGAANYYKLGDLMRQVRSSSSRSPFSSLIFYTPSSSTSS